MKHIISLGAGVQSSTMALMAAAGEITPMPDCGIFADTQAEPRAVYEWLAWLEKQLPFPVVRVTRGNLEEDALNTNLRARVASPPWYTIKDGKIGMLPRACTREYKIEPITKKVRELAGLAHGERTPKGVVRCSMWIGISTDEHQRVKPNRAGYIENRWPLIELGMTRDACLRWMEKRGFPRPAKSACYFCPYHDDAMWRDMKLNQPEEFQRAVEFDDKIRHKTIKGMTHPAFVYRGAVPLRDADLRSAEDAGQARLFDEQGFAVECEGMCGV